MLLKIERKGAYSNIALSAAQKNAGLSERDNALFGALVMGVLERRLTLDYNLSLYLKKDIKKLKPEVLTLLRLGAYQLLFMERVPARAAVSESVALASDGMSYAAGIINAVLRRVAENGLILPKAEAPEFHSVKYSVPAPLYALLCESVGEQNAARFLENAFGRPELTVRVNTLKTDVSGLLLTLKNEGVSAKPHELVDNAVTIEDARSLTMLNAFREGLFHVQDASSQLCVKALSPKPDDTVLDVCAAPGGKSFTVAQHIKGQGRLLSCDLTENRLNLIKDGARRLELRFDCRKNDASVFDSSLPFFDAVLCDVPCSGLGVIGKKPEIRYKSIDDFNGLPELQYKILSVSSRYVKKGGTLVYSTCTLSSRENADVVLRFLSENAAFTKVKVLPQLERTLKDDGDFLTLLPPFYDCDGFFIAKLIKE